MSIFHHVGSTVDWATGYAIIFQYQHRLSQRQAGTPVGQNLVERGLMNHTISIGGIFFICGHIGSAHRRHQTGKDRVTIATDHQKFTISTFIGIGGYNAGHSGT